MYTGIVDHTGKIIEITEHGGGITILFECQFTDIQLGESISVDGICLTAVAPKNNLFKADLSPETLKLTNAKAWKVGQQVNLERSLLATDRFGGHFVMGHVDTTATVAEIKPEGDYHYYRFNKLPKEAKPYFVKKGSVALNGASLTVNEITEDGFAVMLIPHTLERTNLSNLTVGSTVNIEYDYLARYVLRQEEVA